MKLLFLGTGPFAVPAFESLVAGPHDLVGLITRPAPESTRRRTKAPPNPMRQAAERLGVPVEAPASINDEIGLSLLRNSDVDLLVVCDYGQILSSEALSCSRLGGINLHGSLLPKFRGAAPVHWAILNGETETGVTVIHMTPRLDGGPILVQERTAIGDEETQLELEQRLSQQGVAAVDSALRQLATWDGESPLGELQDPSGVTKAPRLNKAQGAIDWTQFATQLHRQVRAFQPWPGSYTWLHSDSQPARRLLLEQVRVASSEAGGPARKPGEVVRVAEDGLTVQTGQGQLVLRRVQPAGKKSMEVSEFLRGNRVEPGDRLGTEVLES